MESKTFYRQTATAIAGYLLQELSIRPGVHWTIRNAISGPRVLTLNVVLNPTYAKRVMGMSEALSMVAGLDREAHVRVSRGNRGSLALEIPKPASLWYNIGVGSLPRRRGLLASVGLDSEQRPALVNFGDPLTPHCLVAGATGSGKTNVARVLVYDLARKNDPDQVALILVDTRKRGSAWGPFARLPHLVHPVITDDEMALRALGWAAAEIDRRAESGQMKPQIFIGIDEAQVLLERKEFVRLIGDIAGTGREFGIHLAPLAMQNPTAEQLGDTSIKRNLTARLVGRVDSATAAVVATGQAGTGAELLTGAGDMLLVQPMGVRRVTAALLTERDTAQLPSGEGGSLDLDQYEDVDHVLDQADNEGKRARPDDLEPRHVAVALVAEKGITWLAQRLGIGSGKARRVLEFANALREELITLEAYTTIPPYREGMGGGDGEPARAANGMVVCRYGEEGELSFGDDREESVAGGNWGGIG